MTEKDKTEKTEKTEKAEKDKTEKEKTDKSKFDRVKETVKLLQKFPELGIPVDSPEVQELKEHLDAYVKDGTCWSGTVSFERFGRVAMVKLPKRADKPIEVTLRISS